MSTKQSGGEFLAKTLKGYGVDNIFWVDAILRHMLAHAEAQGIRRVLAHSEKGAAYMADGCARVTGRPAVCMAQSVGAANLASGLQDAWFANSPVIAITGRHVPDKQYRHAYQELDHEPLFSQLTKFSGRIETPYQLAHLTRHAFRVATSGMPGPVHLDVPSNTGDVMDNWQMAEPLVIEERFKTVPAYRIAPEPGAIAALADAINAANAPVIVVGKGAIWSGAQGALLELARGFKLPVVSNTGAKALMSEAPDYNMGVMGSYGTDSANRYVFEADLVVFVGSDVGDQVTHGWRIPAVGTKTASIGVDGSDLGLTLPGTIAVQADPRLALQELMPRLKQKDRDRWLARGRELKATWVADHAVHAASDAVPIRPERICAELSKWLPRDAVVVADTGFASTWFGQLVDMKYSTQTFMRAVGSLGWSFPAAIGAKAGAPDRPVVCFTGDGGFMYHVGELETAARRSLNTITVVNNNACLGQVEPNLRKSQIGGVAGPGMGECYQFLDLDYAAVARSFGAIGIRVDRASDLPAAFDDAMKAGGPVVIDVHSDPAALARNPWAPQ